MSEYSRGIPVVYSFHWISDKIYHIMSDALFEVWVLRAITMNQYEDTLTQNFFHNIAHIGLNIGLQSSIN